MEYRIYPPVLTNIIALLAGRDGREHQPKIVSPADICNFSGVNQQLR
ncbi:hypothetical protein M5E06_26595 [Azospirillum sp. A1-3]|nr:hypothetical protein [Azospirillum sp. A1-3]MCM8737694.1 hypothetical protein [Azospirillum sp. A1-3]